MGSINFRVVGGLSRNTYWSLAGGAIPASAALVSIPYMLSVIGLQLFAITSLILSITIFFYVYDLGMSKTMTFLISNSNSESDGRTYDFDCVGSALSTAFFLGVLITIALYLLVPYFVENWMDLDKGMRKEATLAFELSVLSIVPALVSNTLKGIQEGQSKFKEANICKVFSGASVFLAPMATIAFVSESLVDISLAIVLSRYLSLVLYVIYAIPVSKFLLLRVKYQHLNAIWNYGIWAAISGFISTTFVYGDRFIVAGYLSPKDLSIYILSQDILIRYLLIPWSMAIVLMPMFSSGSPDKGEIVDLYRTQQKHVFRMSFVILLIALIIGLSIIRMIDFPMVPESAQHVVIIQVIGILFCAMSQLPLIYLYGRGVPRLVTSIFLGEFLIYILLAHITFSYFGVIGACVVWSGRLVVEYFFLSYYAERLMKCP